MVGLSRRGFISAGALCGAAMFLGGNLLSRSALATGISAGNSRLLGFESIPAATTDVISLPKGYKTSVLISKGWTTPIESWGDKWALGARIGAVTGYKDTPIGWAVLPFAQGELQYKVTDRVTMVLGYIPPVQDDYLGVFTLHGKIRF